MNQVLKKAVWICDKTIRSDASNHHDTRVRVRNLSLLYKKGPNRKIESFKECGLLLENNKSARNCLKKRYNFSRFYYHGSRGSVVLFQYIFCHPVLDTGAKKRSNQLNDWILKKAATYSPTSAVPSAQTGLTSLFGKVRGEPRRYNHLSFMTSLFITVWSPY
jgi:hypothetical protein